MPKIEVHSEVAAEGSAPVPVPVPVPELGEDAIYEVLRRADARTLAAAACVSRRWRRLAADERLWEAACVRHWEAARDYGGARLRPVVLALGGFRRLHSLYLAPLLRPPHPSPPPIAASSSSPSPIAASSPSPSPIAAWPMEAAPAPARPRAAAGGRRWGRDEVQLSLSLLSIGFFERMSAGEYKGGGGGGGGGEGDGRG
ncbi:F-box protein GID2 [Ananas comosus]|uniref:F-box protein GID2 n=1 Tax=Ananas comosus TaxID=4615 RepID=A0A199VGS2_ANACO|nr:F-box protein GID2 [Ananas comosus]